MFEFFTHIYKFSLLARDEGACHKIYMFGGFYNLWFGEIGRVVG